jgi:hypothetical protein
VQGLPAGLSKKVGVGNFVRLDGSPRIAGGKKGLAADKPKPIANPVKSKLAGGVVTLTLDLGKADPGFFKYDLLGDGKTLLDPELEIKGPKR